MANQYGFKPLAHSIWSCYTHS